MKLNISKILNIIGTLSSIFLIIWSISTHSSAAYLSLGIILLISNIGQIRNAWNLDKKAM